MHKGEALHKVDRIGSEADLRLANCLLAEPLMCTICHEGFWSRADLFLAYVFRRHLVEDTSLTKRGEAIPWGETIVC